MCLPTTQVDQFYQIWFSLLHFANEELKIVPALSGKGSKDSIDGNLALKIRDALWKDEKVLDQFIARNPAQLSPENLIIAESWKQRRPGQFIIFRALKKHAIFISQDERADVFAVRGLYNSFEEMLGPYMPALVDTVLLPFGHEIITDGLIQTSNLIFGSGIQRELKAIYDDAKECGEIITTLMPGQQSLTRENMAAKAQATNEKVIEAFSKYQYKSGRSPKTVERDIINVTGFARFLRLENPEPASLRDFQRGALESFLVSVPEKERKPVSLSLKRLLWFLQDTGRLNWDEAQDLLDMIKQV